jgi:hypothetical protein
MTDDKEIIQLLKSGKFTIAYHDQGSCSLYEDKIKYYDDLPVDGELANFESWDCEEGYLPKIVRLLVEALGGEVITL